jgi:hypothetical protein
VIGRQILFGFIFLLFSRSPAEAQSLHYGGTVGVPLNSLATADDSLNATTRRYTFGVSLSADIPGEFGLDVDLLYKRLDLGFSSDPARINSHRLELAPMIRFAFHSSSIRPFIHAGMSFNWIIGGGGSGVCADTPGHASRWYCIEGKSVAELRHSHTHGFVVGAGAEFHRGVLRLRPEFRFTRWVDRNFGTQDSSLRSNLSQMELLCGFIF